jgi:hypothetical protein
MGGNFMNITKISYKRLVSFRDDEGRPANETLGATAVIDAEYESPEECRKKLIDWVELELLERGNLRESTQALLRRKDVLENRIRSLHIELNDQRDSLEQVLKIRSREIHEDLSDDLPF